MKYNKITTLYEKLNSTTKRLAKTSYLAEFLKENENLETVIPLLTGDITSEDLGISTKLVIKGIAKATGKTEKEVESEWKNTGDLGETAQYLLQKSKQTTLFNNELDAEDIISSLQKVAKSQGTGSTDDKLGVIARLYNEATGLEAKYITRTILKDMRTGVSEGILRDSIANAFLKDHFHKETLNREEYNSILDLIQNALDMTNDFVFVAKKAKKGKKELEKIDISLGKPLKLMLFPKATDIEEAFKTVGKKAAFEYKYDGFRVQIHKSDKIRIFTRRLEDITAQFPDIVKLTESIQANNFILDAEAVGYDPKTGEYLPFQSISQRIRRKYNIDEMSKKFPVEINVFDIIMNENKSLIKLPFTQRRKLIEQIVSGDKIRPATQIITDDPKKAGEFYKKSLEKGFEGVMAKSLDGIYKPGRRVGYGVKLKPVMEELDLVITRAEWGTGKRGKWLTSYYVACRDEDEYKEIGKVSSGLKELEENGITYSKITDILKPKILAEDGKIVTLQPTTVIEVNYEEIQTSPTYESKYALRFPRIIRLREDKALDEVTSLSHIKLLFNSQKGK